jgi:phosphoribosylformimino-5-aminoimidazole carboxamide ribotide isomerase
MLILPAIDIRGGQCVRLRQGDYAQETIYSSDPAAMARTWVDQGATFLHIVDLDGAKEGHPVNQDSIQRIVQTAGVPCQLGGGLRTEEHVADALAWGLRRVVIGTKAVSDPAWLKGICDRFPGQVALGIDAKDGQVAIQGWLEVSDQPAVELAHYCAGWPLAAIVYTDIARDGMLAGPNLKALAEISKAVTLPIIASGGITTLEDLRRLAELDLAGCIVGRALYEGRLHLPEAINCVQESSSRAKDKR